MDGTQKGKDHHPMDGANPDNNNSNSNTTDGANDSNDGGSTKTITKSSKSSTTPFSSLTASLILEKSIILLGEPISASFILHNPSN